MPRRLTWSWLGHASTGNGAFNNRPLHEREWQADDTDTLLEETRLLYVALTRPRHELVVQHDPKKSAGAGAPTCWQQLLGGRS